MNCFVNLKDEKVPWNCFECAGDHGAAPRRSVLVIMVPPLGGGSTHHHPSNYKIIQLNFQNSQILPNFGDPINNVQIILQFHQTCCSFVSFLLQRWIWSGANICTYCRSSNMLYSYEGYLVAKSGFITAGNEHSKFILWAKNAGGSRGPGAGRRVIW